MKSYKKMCQSGKETTEELYNAIKEGGSGGAGKVTIIREDGEGDILTVYTLYQDDKQITPSIQIPKSQPITKIEIVEIEGVKYLRIYYNDTEYVEIPLTELVKVYEADEVSLTLTGNKFSIHDGYLEKVAITGNYTDLNEIPTLDGKELKGALTIEDLNLQEKLINQNNIKSINNESLLGSGNIDIQGGGVTVVDIVEEGNMNPITSNAVAKALSKFVTDTGIVNIVVVNKYGKRPIEGATVKLGDNTLKSDATGNCYFRDLKYGNYKLVITKDGFDEYIDSIVLEKDLLEYKADINPEKIPTQVRVEGTVTNKDNKPLYDANVVIDDVYWTRTNKEGKYAYPYVYDYEDVDTIKVEFTHADYKPLVKEIPKVKGQSTYIIDAVMDEGFSYSLTVMYEDGTPAEDVNVGIYKSEDDSCVYEGTTNFGGIMYFGVDKGADYDIYAYVFQNPLVKESLGSISKKEAEITVPLPTCKTGDIVLNILDGDTGEITGHAIKATLESVTGKTYSGITNKSTGKCEINNVDFGIYTLELDDPLLEYETLIKTFAVDKSNPKETLYIKKDPTIKYVTCKGTVRDTNDNVLEDVNVDVMANYSDLTNSNGEYSIQVPSHAITGTTMLFRFTKDGYKKLDQYVTVESGKTEYTVDVKIQTK